MGKILLLIVLLTVSGCDVLRGPKGDQGDRGASTQADVQPVVYKGTPTSNPYKIYCPEISQYDKQIIEVYAESEVAPGAGFPTLYPLPITGRDYHFYTIYGQFIEFCTQYSDGTLPDKALLCSTGKQWTYYIKIYTVAKAPQRRIDQLIYGGNK
jgi:hypothetical protein